MNKQKNINRSIRFRRWSRKAYAVFCSLGRVVTIGNLKKSAIEASMAKQHNTSGIIINDDSNSLSLIKKKEKEEIDTGPNGTVLLQEILLMMLQPQRAIEIYCASYLTDKFINRYAGQILIVSARLFYSKNHI